MVTQLNDSLPASSANNYPETVQQTIEYAIQLCQKRGTKLTTIRQQVLALVCASQKPVGAYTLLQHLRNRAGKPAAPPTVYRALDFLVAQNLVHRISSLNAYISCTHPEKEHAAQFLICQHCGIAMELQLPQVTCNIVETANNLGFSIAQPILEIHGYCANCQLYTQQKT